MRHFLIANVALVKEGFPRLYIRDSPHLLLRGSEAESENSKSAQHVPNTVPHFLQSLLHSSLGLKLTVMKRPETLGVMCSEGGRERLPHQCD